MPNPAGPHAQLAGPAYQAPAHAHQTGRGGAPHPSSLPYMPQLGVPKTAAPVGFTSDTWATDDKKQYTTAMCKLRTGGGRFPVHHNAMQEQQPG